MKKNLTALNNMDYDEYMWNGLTNAMLGGHTKRYQKYEWDALPCRCCGEYLSYEGQKCSHCIDKENTKDT